MRAFALALMLGAFAARAQQSEPAPGTTIVGERDAALGLYIAPWKEEAAGDLDRPPALYEEPLEPIDPRSFREQLQTAETIADWRRNGAKPPR